MKRMQKLIVLVLALCLILSVGIFVACEEVHEHSFGSEYEADEANHWNVCSCGEKSEIAAHVDADGDELCDVCGKKLPHVHKYTEYISDDLYHWPKCPADNVKDESGKARHVDADNDRACDVCGHHMHGHVLHTNETKHWYECPDEPGDALSWGVHVDEDNDGKCDVCEYVMHVHDYSELGFNNDNHWNYCSCPDGSTAIDDSSVAAHVDVDADGKCDVCGHDVPIPHVHNYSKIGYDDDYHWNYCPDDDDIDESSKSAHVDANWDEKCDVCGADVFADHEHDLTFVPNDVTKPSVSVDGQATLTCTEDGCAYNRVISLKYLNTGEQVSVSAEPNEELWFYARADGLSIYIPSNASISIGETTTLEWVISVTQSESDFQYEVEYIGGELESGNVNLNNSKIVLFKASATDGKISFTMDYAPGEKKSSAISIEKNKTYEGDSSNGDIWFKYTATAKEDIVLYNPDGYTSVIVNEESYAKYKYNIYSLDEGETLYINVSWSLYSFMLKDKEEGVSYDGWTPSTAIEINDDSYTSSGDVIGTKYYKIVATQEGRLVLNIEGNNNVEYVLGEYYYGWFKDYWSGCPYLEEGDVVYAEVTCSSENANASYSIAVSYTQLVAVDNEFIVKDIDGNAMENIGISLKNSKDEEVYSGVTDSEGKVIISFVPGNYSVILSGFDSALYSYIPVSTKWDAEDADTDNGQTYEITLVKAVQKTFIIKGGDICLEGVTVKITDTSNNLIVSGVTDSEGKVTLSYVPAASGLRYKVQLSGFSDMYSYNSMVRFETTDVSDMPISLDSKVAYSIKVVAPEGVEASVEGLSVGINSLYGMSMGSGVTDANGEAVIYINYDNDYVVSVSGLPYYLKGEGSLPAGTHSLEITLQNVNRPQLSVGNNSISLNYANYEWNSIEYVFVSENGGSYKLSFGDDAGDCVYVYIDDFSSPILSSNTWSYIGSYSFSLKAGEGIVLNVSCNSYDDIEECTYTLIISEDENKPVVGDNALVIGDNDVSVGHNGEEWDFVDYTFTSVEGGSFVLTLVDEIGSAAVYNRAVSEWEPIVVDDEYEGVLSYRFQLDAGESIVFSVSSNNYSIEGDHAYVLNIAVDDGAAEQPVSFLSFGDNLVLGTSRGNILTFTSEEGGEFIISSKDDNYWLVVGDEETGEDYKFSLEPGGSIEFCFMVYSYSDESDTYIVTISNAMAK